MSEPTATELDDIEALLDFIRDSRGFDFTSYKRSTLARRIQKRMEDVGAASVTDYRDFLETTADEFNVLFNTILINVTSFFREPAAWEFLQQSVLPDLVASVPSDGEIRIWSAGCSSGEEAYSLAMVFAELMGVEECVRRVKIYGTDIDEEALREARSGFYTPKAIASVPDDLRERYFESSGTGYAFRPDLRRRVIFGRHDITRDAPISRLHLLSCRNTLMYFNVEAQRQIVDRFHFALQSGAFLFLGKSEMLLSDGERFEALSIRHRIFRRRAGVMADLLQPAPIRLQSTAPLSGDEGARRRRLVEEIAEALPNPMIVLDDRDTVIVVNSQARSSLGLSEEDVGRRFSDLQISYRPMELRSLLERAKSERRSFRADSVEYQQAVHDGSRFYTILVEPLITGERLLGTAVVFTDTTRAANLEEELRSTRENLETASAELQSSNEELETTNEELQSSIEELETTNEELQATNEELETTNEELQSSNEELETMNEEMRIRTSELDDARAFSDGVLDSISGSIIVLDAGFAIHSWNHGAQEMWGLRSDEVEGRPFFSVEFGLPTAALHDPVHTCLASGRRPGKIELHAINRLGQGITCTVLVAPLEGRAASGVVLLIQEVGREAPVQAAKDAAREP